MAARKPKVKKIKFELTRSGILGIGVVCFCIFLWMFLLGVWAGQSLLFGPKQIKEAVGDKVARVQKTGVPLLSADRVKKKY
ncbi:MAG: hypothetical protein ABFS19_03605 [Thermodesulfobacteriota bacterium]